MKPLVSILIPAYNAQAWIRDTIRSALAQTWERKEIIIIDDGSTDNTVAVVREFESDTVRVLTQENQGAAATRNRCFSVSRGDYIQWLDADDLLGPEKIFRQMACVSQGTSRHTVLSGGWAPFLYRHSKAEFVPSALWCDLSPVEWLTRKMEHNLHMQTATWLVSRGVTDSAGPWNTRLLGDDDGEYFCRVLLASDSVRFVKEAKVYYRQSGAASLSYVGRSNPKLTAQWKSMELHIRYLRSLEDSERTRQACLKYLQRWLICFYPERPDIVTRAEVIAKELGGGLETPALSWKYSWIKSVFGWDVAKRVGVALPRLRWALTRSWDRALYRIESYASP